MYAKVVHRKQGLVNSVEKYSIGVSNVSGRVRGVRGSYDRYFIKDDLSSFSPNGLKKKTFNRNQYI